MALTETENIFGKKLQIVGIKSFTKINNKNVYDNQNFIQSPSKIVSVFNKTNVVNYYY